MAKAMVGSWPTTALLAIGIFVTSAMAEDAPSPSADAPRSDQRRLRILLSAGPVPWIETGAQVGGALSFRTGTHTAAFVAIDKGPSDEVTRRLGFRFVTRPYSSVTPYFSFAYARVSDDAGRSFGDPPAPGMVSEWGIEYAIRGRTRAFVGGRATLLGNSEGGGLAHVAVTLGVNVGLQ